MTLGRPHVHHRTIGSTNDHAKALARAGAPHGTIVTADEQTAGRGRQGRRWSTPAGRALALSAILRDLGERFELLPLLAAVAVCEACEAVAPVRCAIKWPNDVWIDGRKLSGILAEGRPHDGWAVLGIGVNVTLRAEELPPELAETATSLAIAAPGAAPTRSDALLGPLLDRLARRLADEPAAVLAAWRERDALRGRVVRWDGNEGVAAGIGDRGELLVETDGGAVELQAGEVHLER